MIVVERAVTVIRLFTRRSCRPAAAVRFSHVVLSFFLILSSLLVVTICVRNFFENDRFLNADQGRVGKTFLLRGYSLTP